jgi:hypothetical protein
MRSTDKRLPYLFYITVLRQFLCQQHFCYTPDCFQTRIDRK